MPTVGQILSYLDRKFPNTETTANKISDLNDIQNNVFIRIKKLSNDYVTAQDTTVADQTTYTLPTGCKIENIAKIAVSTDTAGTEFKQYDVSTITSDVSVGNFYLPINDNTIALIKDGDPIDTSNLIIMYYYFKEPTQLSATSQTPCLDPMYHNALKYALVSEIASQGRHPHVEIANYWQHKFDEVMESIESNINEKLKAVPVVLEEIEFMG
jgi:hypothetical protein